MAPIKAKYSNLQVGLAFTGFAFSVAGAALLYAINPFRKQVTPTTDEALNSSLSIRGTYLNSGSRDVGPDNSRHNPYLPTHPVRIAEAERAAAEAAAKAQHTPKA